MAEYAAVPHTEDDEHLPRRKRRFSHSSFFSRDQLAEFSSAPVAIAAGVLLTAVSIWVLYAIFSGISAHRQTLLGEEINSLVPEFPRVPRVFWNDSSYGPDVDISTLTKKDRERVLDNWAELIPEGEGFVPVDDPTKSTLPPPLQKDDPSAPYYYAMSVFHQIHCLDSILRMFLDADRGDHRSHSHAGDTAHAMHCFDYLRQAIMCCGDTALEGADPYTIAKGKDTLSFGTFGIGSTHMCKDYGAIYAYAKTHANPRWLGRGSGQE
ncbi:hypothetical protein BFW01_g10226 [Lasiodiplodia theobromae]|uniref:Oxidase ustYa n=1 Tax=Lasiodiplodia theobromae TaxID=45133 RepID=A0A8H7INE3_9PEZI|nr:hypothetical protein BFW01_g10226 [Lasiodiplodia theobromae]